MTVSICFTACIINISDCPKEEAVSLQVLHCQQKKEKRNKRLLSRCRKAGVRGTMMQNQTIHVNAKLPYIIQGLH